jgi:hypothetical protein
MWCHKLSSEKPNVHQFLVEQTRQHQTTASSISEIHNLSTLCWFADYSVTAQQSNCYVQQDTQARNKPDISDSQQLCINNPRVQVGVGVWFEQGRSFWKGVGVVHKIMTDNYFWSVKFSATCTRGKLMHVVQFFTTRMRCHLRLVLNMCNLKEVGRANENHT